MVEVIVGPLYSWRSWDR